ncbi:MAG: GFA family protein [Pseudomonadota bacterium]
MTVSNTATGSCLCGGVAYRLHGELRPVINCFCGQCQKTSGHHFAATRVAKDRFELTREETLSWYRSSDLAERGFCSRCGGNLFWRRHEDDGISVTAGTLDKPTGLSTSHNIFVEDASDYQIVPELD